MRTKTLLLTAAIGAAGVATSMAQVFSVNAVGYVNVTAKPGFALIANPLKATDNKVSSLLGANVPGGTTVYKYNSTSGQYDINTFDFGAWSDPNMTLEPGEGAFLSNPGPGDLTITFVGEVPQGQLSNPIPAGFSIRASQVPQSGALDTVLGFPVADGDTIYQFNQTSQNYDLNTYDFGAWSAGQAPTLAVGESVFVNKAAAANWTRTFSVN